MPEILHLLSDRISTPIGPILIAADLQGNLRTALFTEDEQVIRRQLRLQYGDTGFTLKPANDPCGLAAAISSYFSGQLHVIDTISVETGGTPFQRQVWRALREIPCWRDLILRRTGAANRPSRRGPRCRSSQRRQSGCSRGPLSPGDRFQRFVDRLRRRNRTQTLAARSRTQPSFVIDPISITTFCVRLGDTLFPRPPPGSFSDSASPVQLLAFAATSASFFRIFPPSSTTYSRFTSRSFNTSTAPEGQLICTRSIFFASPIPK